MQEFKTGITRFSGNIYAIDQEMVRAYVVVGEEKALCFDFGVAPVDFKSLLGRITRLPVVFVLSHADRDHVANIGCAEKVFLDEMELPYLNDLPCSKLVPAEEGMVFDLGGLSLEVVSTPGHTPGSISLLWRDGRILFSGDTVSYGPVYMFGPSRNLDQYIESLEKLLKMAEKGVFSDIYPSHNLSPIKTGAIKELITVSEKVRDGSAIGMPPGRDFPGFDGVRLFSYGKCGIFFK